MFLRFELGEIVITDEAKEFFAQYDDEDIAHWETAKLLARHHGGDHGDGDGASEGGKVVASGYTLADHEVNIVTISGEQTVIHALPWSLTIP